MGVFAHGSALGAMCPQVERAVPTGFLPDPDAVLDFGNHRAANRTVCADGFDRFYSVVYGALGTGPCDRSAGCSNCSQATNGQAGSAQKCPAVDRLFSCRRQDTCPLGASRNPVGLFPKHLNLPCCNDRQL